MASCSVPADLATFLEQHCEKARKAKSTVLFRRGEIWCIPRSERQGEFGR